MFDFRKGPFTRTVAVAVTVKVYRCSNGDGPIGFGTHSVHQCKFDGHEDGTCKRITSVRKVNNKWGLRCSLLDIELKTSPSQLFICVFGGGGVSFNLNLRQIFRFQLDGMPKLALNELHGLPPLSNILPRVKNSNVRTGNNASFFM